MKINYKILSLLLFSIIFSQHINYDQSEIYYNQIKNIEIVGIENTDSTQINDWKLFFDSTLVKQNFISPFSFEQSNLSANTNYTIKLSSESRDIEDSYEFWTLSKPIDMLTVDKITESTASILIKDDNNNKTQHLIKIVDTKTSQVAYYDPSEDMVATANWITLDNKNITLKNLKSNTKYEVHSTTRNNSNIESESVTTNIITYALPVDELIVKDLDFSSISIEINDKNNIETEYNLEIKKISTNERWYYNPDLSNNKMDISITDLESNTAYQFTLRTRNLDGLENKNQASLLAVRAVTHSSPILDFKMDLENQTPTKINLTVNDENNEDTKYQLKVTSPTSNYEYFYNSGKQILEKKESWFDRKYQIEIQDLSQNTQYFATITSKNSDGVPLSYAPTVIV